MPLIPMAMGGVICNSSEYWCQLLSKSQAFDLTLNMDLLTFGIFGLFSYWCSYQGTPRKVATPGDGTLVTQGRYGTVSMVGREVYKFATREVPEVLTECLEAAGMTVDQVDWLLLHQANIRIMEAVAKRLGMPMSKVITNLADYGNTSAASIPLALDEAVRAGKVKKGDTIACAGFGAGLSWGATIFKWG